MSTTTYTVVNGVVLSQNKDGVVHHLIPDPLGSVVMVRDTSGNTVYTAEYAPYGDVQSETGTNPSEFGYVGTLGYVKDSASSLYVRARYLLTNLGRWLTKDPLWPRQPGFVYAGAAPIEEVDPSGLMTYGDCIRDAENQLLTNRQACMRCQMTLRGKSLEQAKRICAHLPNTRLGPKPPELIPGKPGGKPYVSPPDWVNVIISACGYQMPGGDLLGLIEAPNLAVCALYPTMIRHKLEAYCEGSEPGRDDFPNTPPEYWDHLCEYLNYAKEAWSAFCVDYLP